MSCMNLFRKLIEDFESEEFYNRLDLKTRGGIIDNKFVFSLIWSLGGSVITEDRK